MASVSDPIECRLAPHARLLLYVAAAMARVWLPLPHRLIVAVTNRSWSIKIGNGPWLPYRGKLK